MKKYLLISVFAVALGFVSHAQQWNSFTSASEPGAPEVNVQSSNYQSVSFEVTIPGIYTIDTIVNGTSFTRLILPDGFAVNPAGSPEIPVLSYKVAIPDCDGVEVTYSIVSQQTMPSCWVYPVPEIVFEQNPTGGGQYVEQFTFDAAAYAQPYSSEPTAAIASTGALRMQKYAEAMVQVVEFCPVTQQLSVIDKVEITLTFTNPHGDLRQNTGFFNKIAAKTFINYEDDGTSALSADRAFEKPDFTRGNVQWKTITTPADADVLVADYLIVCTNTFFNTHNADIQRLADHRAWYNGYDVAIVNIEHILSDAVGFYFEEQDEHPGPNYQYKREQRLRTFIRRVFEGQNAHHSDNDGHVAFVLLVGDNEDGNLGMPTGYDHDVMYHGDNNLVEPYASDYYFTCVTKNASEYDDVGDMFLGRFSVGSVTDLYNMVEKTINHETKFDSEDAWRKTVGFTTGASYSTGAFEPYYGYYVDFVTDLLDNNDIEWDSHFVHGESTREATLDLLNEGVVFTQYIGRNSTCGVNCNDPLEWEDELFADIMELELQNGHRAPFITAIPGNTGEFDRGVYCMGEFLTCYDSIKGAVGYIGASRYTDCQMGSTGNILYFHKCFPYYLFGKHDEQTSIAGELLRTSQITAHSIHYLYKYAKYAYNLFGDPALNILATGGCEQIVQSKPYPTQRVLYEGDCLEILDDVVLTLTGPGSISVQGGQLTIGDNVTIIGHPLGDPARKIDLQYGTIVIGDNVTIENTPFFTNISLSNMHFIDVDFTRNKTSNVFNMTNCTFDGCTVLMNNHLGNANITNCTFTDNDISLIASLTEVPLVATISNSHFSGSLISHYRHKLEATNCTFTNRSDIIAAQPVVEIDHCSFSESGFRAGYNGLVHVPMGFTPFTTFVKISNSSFRNTGTFYAGTDALGQTPIYSSAAIKLGSISEFQLLADTIINVTGGGSPYGEGIYLDNAGNGVVDNRLVSGNKITQCETGVHVYNSKATFKNNEIYENYYGVRIFNNSQTSFTGEENIANGQQFIRDNVSYEIYASNNAFPSPFIYNQIIDEDNGGNPLDPLLYYDYIPGPGTPTPIPINISCNYWGENFVQNDDIYQPNRFIISPIWDPQTGDCTSGGKSLYDVGIDYFADENYLAAKAAFTELITTYPDDQFSIAALHELFALEQFIDDDYAALHDYYATFTPADSTLFDVADFLATRCNVTLQNWQLAIDWYENRIENSPSYQDSIFAVIDLGDIHLSMEADSTNLKSGRIGYGRFLNLVPKSRREYEENKAELLATLPKMDDPRQQHPLAEPGKKGVLRQNIPNPATGSTTVVYDVVEEGAVELRLYNQLGQLLQALPQGTQKPGSYRIEISLAGLPSAMYHYILFVEGEKADAKKLIVN